MILKVKSVIGKTAGWQAFHQSSCSCSWLNSQVLVIFNLKELYYLMRLEIISFFLAQDTWLKYETLWIEIQYSKLFRSIKLSSHLHTTNARGAYIFTVVKRTAHNSMLHKRLIKHNKTQSNFMISTAIHTKNSYSMSILIVVQLVINI